MYMEHVITYTGNDLFLYGGKNVVMAVENTLFVKFLTHRNSLSKGFLLKYEVNLIELMRS